jgi:hypothetical protein
MVPPTYAAVAASGVEIGAEGRRRRRVPQSPLTPMNSDMLGAGGAGTGDGGGTFSTPYGGGATGSGAAGAAGVGAGVGAGVYGQGPHSLVSPPTGAYAFSAMPRGGAIIKLSIHLPFDHMRQAELIASQDWTLSDVFNRLRQRLSISATHQVASAYVFFYWETGKSGTGGDVKRSVLIDAQQIEESTTEKSSNLAPPLVGAMGDGAGAAAAATTAAGTGSGTGSVPTAASSSSSSSSGSSLSMGIGMGLAKMGLGSSSSSSAAAAAAAASEASGSVLASSPPAVAPSRSLSSMMFSSRDRSGTTASSASSSTAASGTH